MSADLSVLHAPTVPKLENELVVRLEPGTQV